jgi:uncharacterized protein YjbI with pentapeptide repeats
MATFARSSDLRGAEFIGADLRGARFAEADLSGVVMRGVSVEGVDIDDRSSAIAGATCASTAWT